MSEWLFEFVKAFSLANKEGKGGCGSYLRSSRSSSDITKLQTQSWDHDWGFQSNEDWTEGDKLPLDLTFMSGLRQIEFQIRCSAAFIHCD